MMILAAAMMAQAPAAQPAPVQSAPRANAAPAKGKLICKVDDADTASRLRRRICLSQTEWDRKESGVDANDLKTLSGH